MRWEVDARGAGDVADGDEVFVDLGPEVGEGLDGEVILGCWRWSGHVGSYVDFVRTW